jgi:ankyrin repeat protein
MSGWLAHYQQKGRPKGGPPNDLSPKTLFFQAIVKGDHAQCEMELGRTEVKDLSCLVDPHGNPPSMVALEQHMWHFPPESDKWVDIMKFLGNEGFDLNQPNRDGWTVLQVCARNRDNVCPRLLTTIKQYVGSYHP